MPDVLDVPPDLLPIPDYETEEVRRLLERAEKIREEVGDALAKARKANIRLTGTAASLETGKGIFRCLSQAMGAIGIALQIGQLVEIATDETTRQPRRTRRRRAGNMCVLSAITELEELHKSLEGTKGLNFTELRAMVTDNTEKRKRRTFKSRA